MKDCKVFPVSSPAFTVAVETTKAGVPVGQQQPLGVSECSEEAG